MTSTQGVESHEALAQTPIRALGGRQSAWTAVASLAWLASAVITIEWPNADDSPRTAEFAVLQFVVALFVFASLALGTRAPRLHARVRKLTPWLVVLALGFTAWEIVTAKLQLLPRPFFEPPQALIDVFAEDWPRLGTSVLASLRLLVTGYLLGACAGFGVGVSIGWSRAAGYWLHPVLRFVGPLPATAWLPLAFFFFPSSYSAGLFLIALSTSFPVAVLTWSGVAAVDTAFYDIARTLGARSWFLVLRVAIPAALPSVFVGLFMGLGAAFSVLVVAEMMGVKAGLGWYLSWAQGWASYANMYAALLVMAVMCSGLITGLFKARDRLLGWQKGAVKW